MGAHLSKDNTSQFTSNEVRKPVIKLSLTSQRRVTGRFAKQGVVNASNYLRGASSKKRGLTVNPTRRQRSTAFSTAVAETGPAHNSNNVIGIIRWFDHQPFAMEHCPRTSDSTLRDDTSDRSYIARSRQKDCEVGEVSSSSPLPIPTCKHSPFKAAVVDEGGDVEYLRRIYDMRTWDMYIRISESRRYSTYQSHFFAKNDADGPGTMLDHHSDSEAGFPEYNDELVFDLE